MCHCGWDPPRCISSHHPPQPPPPSRPNPLRQCVWSAPTIDRYIVPDRLDRATGQQTGGRWGQREREGAVGWGFLGNVCFSVSNLVQPEELHTPLRLKRTIHDGLTYMITHKCPLLTYTHTHTHYHNNHASLKAHQPHGENLSPSSSFIVPWLVIANALPNYTPVKVITLLSSASLNDFSPLSPALKGLFDVSRSISGCCIDRVGLHVPPISAQRTHCFIFESTAPSEMDYFSRALLCLGPNTPGWSLHVLIKL